MKKYKLIKLYPNSPVLGTVVIYSEDHQIYNYNGGNYYTEFPKHQVENLPEYWEEVTSEPLKYSMSDVKNITLDFAMWARKNYITVVTFTPNYSNYATTFRKIGDDELEYNLDQLFDIYYKQLILRNEQNKKGM
jgi:hypothetical protein